MTTSGIDAVSMFYSLYLISGLSFIYYIAPKMDAMSEMMAMKDANLTDKQIKIRSMIAIFLMIIISPVMWVMVMKEKQQ